MKKSVSDRPVQWTTEAARMRGFISEDIALRAEAMARERGHCVVNTIFVKRAEEEVRQS